MNQFIPNCLRWFSKMLAFRPFIWCFQVFTWKMLGSYQHPSIYKKGCGWSSRLSFPPSKLNTFTFHQNMFWSYERETRVKKRLWNPSIYKTPLFLHTVRLVGWSAGPCLWWKGDPSVARFLPVEFRGIPSSCGGSEVNEHLVGQGPGGVQKIMANNVKRIPPWLSRFFFGGMKHYPPVMWGFQYAITRTPIQQPGFNGRFLRVFFEAQVSICIPNFSILEWMDPMVDPMVDPWSPTTGISQHLTASTL